MWSTRTQVDWDKVCQVADADDGARDLETGFITQRGVAFHARARRVVVHAMRQEQRTEMHARSTLPHLRRIDLFADNIQPYLKGQRGEGTRLKMQCRTGTLPVNALLHARRQAGHVACALCGEPESVTHLVAECPAVG